jgi:hypothetical protein
MLTLMVELENTSTATNQTVAIESGESNFITLVHWMQDCFVPLTDITSELSESHQTMIASERSLAKEWDLPEEDDAWADL